MLREAELFVMAEEMLLEVLGRIRDGDWEIVLPALSDVPGRDRPTSMRDAVHRYAEDDARAPEALAGVPDGAPVVLLTHNPDVVVDVPDHVALVVAGHTHAGQVRVLGRGVHRVSERSGNRWSHGWYAGDRLYVTPGIGSSTLPLRTVVPEVPVLVLASA